MAEWLRRQIRIVADLSDGVSPRRFKSCSGSGVLWILPLKVNEEGSDIITFSAFSFELYKNRVVKLVRI